MAAAAQESCRKRCIRFLISLGFTALLLWLSTRPDEPHCYLDEIYVPTLDKTLNPSPKKPPSSSLSGSSGTRTAESKYDDVHLYFKVFVSVNTTHPLGNATVKSFYQGLNRKAFKPGSLNDGGNLTTVVAGKVVYRVNFTSAVKHKIFWWYRKRPVYGEGQIWK